MSAVFRIVHKEAAQLRDEVVNRVSQGSLPRLAHFSANKARRKLLAGQQQATCELADGMSAIVLKRAWP